ncbi:MAG: hypothetical protein KQJ78_06445 [Deltaproteobacteria bacterium]|nr:hypothetical protein [Deltaproteobacteria bacterium]
MKIARTIADLDASPGIGLPHLSEALGCRSWVRMRGHGGLRRGDALPAARPQNSTFLGPSSCSWPGPCPSGPRPAPYPGPLGPCSRWRTPTP